MKQNVMLYLQTSLEMLLPSWEVIEQQKEAIAFACGLSCQPDILLQVISERLIGYMQSSVAKRGVSYKHVELQCWTVLDLLLLLKDQLKERKLKNIYVYLCSRYDISDIEIESKVYVIESESDDAMAIEDRGLSQKRNIFMLTRKCTEQDINGNYIAFGHCSGLLFLLKEMRKLFQVVLSGVFTPPLNLRESELPPNSLHPVLVGSFTFGNIAFREENSLDAATGLMQEISKYQQVVINHLDIDGCNKKSFDDLFSTSVHVSKDTKTLRIVRSDVTPAPCQRIGRDLYGCLPLGQEALIQRITLQVNEQRPFLETLDLSETFLTRSDFYSLVKIQRLPHLKILNLSRINLSGCLRDILSPGSPSLEKLVLRRTLLKNIDISYLSSIFRTKTFAKTQRT